MDDSFSQFQRPGAPFLHPSSDSFGTLDGREIERSFLATGRQLRLTLLRLVDGLTSGSIGVQRFTVSARSAVRTAYYFAYSLGAVSIFPFYTLTDRDVRILDDELDEETGFLRSFGSDLARGRIHLDPVARAGLYLLALRGIFERGRVEAMPVGPYEWRLGITEHCIPCIQAAGNGPYQRSRTDSLGLPELPGSPGDGSVCNGLTRCGCTIRLSSGLELPNQDISDRLRGMLLEIIDGSRTAAQGAGT